MRLFLFESRDGRFLFARTLLSARLPHHLGPWSFYKMVDLIAADWTGKDGPSAVEIAQDVILEGYYLSPFQQGMRSETHRAEPAFVSNSQSVYRSRESVETYAE